MKFLFEILNIPSVSGDESTLSEFILQYIHQRKNDWNVVPEIYHGEDFHDCILLKFGNPRTAVFAHMDTIGFMARYQNQLVSIGGPELTEDVELVGEDSLGKIACRLKGDEENSYHDFPRKIEPGTRLSFKQDVRVDEEFIQAAYLDNRLGVYSAIEICETIRDGWVVFSTYEEHGGGSMPFLLKFIQDKAPIKQALISDITWVTEGVSFHEGVVISIRDKFIPRKKFVDKIIALAEESQIPYQLEVEASGGSDGREVQFSPYAIDWCFIGAAEENVHSPNEKVSLADLDAMVKLYAYLMDKL
ncbi:M20/M25/M40 family metallo-hydrolase [Algoriphagus halophytocola]|uniref:M20/M25/M40 family metallo-hydrolase n=1 Tax=Algoriphagus halophytocola TaxID=2991499 RepID=A0ABY6MF38_9BACT|nr:MULTISPECIES: M20/M25/M40 family metallo-hydrolase [unclassified Algoriphagus]UZD20951.1 M20/M25/M40 family metallo-hydrolase [Algoriphagus sp. TR-M5]WBL42117.1 M20/M25/M40 family metallo-hydrolase [Algoriphagus sp. TR-M9]